MAASFGSVVQSPATSQPPGSLVAQNSVLALVLIRHPALRLWEGGTLSSHSSFTSGSLRRKSQISASSTAGAGPVYRRAWVRGGPSIGMRPSPSF